MAPQILGVPLTTVNLRKNLCVSYQEMHTRVKMATLGPYLNTHRKSIQLYYNSSRVNYTLNTKHISKLRVLIHVFQNIYQNHMSAFFSKAASNERRLPEHSLIPRWGKQCPVVIISYVGYFPPKMHMQWYNKNIHIPYNLQFIHGMIYIMHEMFSMPISRVTHRLPHTCLCQV